MDYYNHHIWCNFPNAASVAECKQCARLFKEFPYGDDMFTENDLAGKYFPEALKRA